MKSTGIVRKVDELGRIVLPMELRKNLNIKIQDPLEIYVEGKKIILEKFEHMYICPVCDMIICAEDCFCRYCGEKVDN